MTLRLVSLLAAATFAAGCSSLDAINPFASSGPKMAPLPPLTATVDLRTLWSASVGKAGDYAFAPAIVGNAVFVANRDGTIAKLVDGRAEWTVKAGQPLSAGVGADASLVVVGTPKGDVLAFSSSDGSPRWKAKASSEVLAAPAVTAAGVAVRSGDHRVFLFDAGDGGRKWVHQRSTPPLARKLRRSPIAIRSRGKPHWMNSPLWANCGTHNLRYGCSSSACSTGHRSGTGRMADCHSIR